ncbi:MAG: hypothetical protein ACOX4L_09985 [Bacillota bacterium]
MSISCVETVTNASGAAEAAARGNIVVIVDVINMSTTLEAALDAGALGVFGASPDRTKAPVYVNPVQIGYLAGIYALMHKTDLILVTEPRVGTNKERIEHASHAILGVQRAGIKKIIVLPNLGCETVKMTDFNGKVVLAVTDSGGVAFDAALNAGGTVTTATVARTLKKKGPESAEVGITRALTLAKLKNTGISIVASSANSLEDVLAANYLTNCLLSVLSRTGNC